MDLELGQIDERMESSAVHVTFVAAKRGDVRVTG